MVTRSLRAVILFLYNLLYQDLAPCYDLIAWLVSGGKWFQWVLATKKFIRGGKILEIGCGTGHMLADLSESGVQAVGLDNSRQMIKVSSCRLKKLALHPRITLVRGKSQNLPFQDSSFDTIILTFPAPFIFEKTTVQEIHRSLRLGGILVILLSVVPIGRFIPNLFSLTELLFRLGKENNRRSSEMYRLFSESGFRVAEIFEEDNNVILLFLRCVKM